MSSLAPKEKKSKKQRSKAAKSGRKSGRKSARAVETENCVWIQVDEIRDTGKSTKEYYFIVYFDDEEVFVSPPYQGLVMDDPGRALELPFSVDRITVEVCERLKVLHTPVFKGKVVFDTEEVYLGYNYDSFFPLVDEEGNTKEKGELKLKMVFLRAGEKFSSTIFTKPLHHLTQEDKHSFLKRKIDEGADVNATDTEGLTPFMLSCLLGRGECCQILADNGSELELFSRKGLNAIHLAASGGHSEIVDALINFGIKPDTITKDSDKYTPLHLAALNCRHRTCKVLLSHGVDVNALSKSNDTAVGLALKAGEGRLEKTLEVLFSFDPDIYVVNDEALSVWEIAMNASPETKASFFKACDVEHPLEFQSRKTHSRYQRIECKNLSPDWKTSSQVVITCGRATPCNIIVYTSDKLQHSISTTSDITYVITKGNDLTSNEKVSYQTGTEEIIAKSAMDFVFDKDVTYHLCAASNKYAGDFSYVIYYGSNKSKLRANVATKWPFSVEVDDEWDDDTAGGSAFGSDSFFENPVINLKFDESVLGDEDAVVSITLKQKVDALSVNLFDIIPGKYHVGFFLVGQNNKNLANSGPWFNASELTAEFRLSNIGTTFDIVPCTQNPGEKGEFTVIIKSTHEFEVE